MKLKFDIIFFLKNDKMKNLDIKKKNEEKDKKDNTADKTKEVKKESEKKIEVSKDSQKVKENKKKNNEEEILISPEMFKDSGAVLLIIIGAFILYSITSPNYAGNIGLIIGNYLNETSGLASILYPTIIILIGCHILKNFPKKVLYFYPLITIGLVWVIEILRCLLLKDFPFLGTPCIVGNFLSDILESAIGKLGATVFLLFLALTFLLFFTGKTFKDLGNIIKEKFLSFCDYLKKTREKISVKLDDINEKNREKKLQKEMEKAQKAELKKREEEERKAKEAQLKLEKLQNNNVQEPNKPVFRASEYTPSVQKNMNLLQKQNLTEDFSIKKSVQKPLQTNNQILNREKNRNNGYLNDYLKQQENRNKTLEKIQNNRRDEVNNKYIDSFEDNFEDNNDYLRDFLRQKENKNKTLEELYGKREIKTTVSTQSEKKANIVFGTGSALGKTITHLREGKNVITENLSNKSLSNDVKPVETVRDEYLRNDVKVVETVSQANPVVVNSVKEEKINEEDIDPAIERRQKFLQKKPNLDPAIERRMKFLQDDLDVVESVVEDTPITEKKDDPIEMPISKDLLLYRNEKFSSKNNNVVEQNKNIKSGVIQQDYLEEIDNNYNDNYYEESLPDVDTLFDDDNNKGLNISQGIEYTKPSLDILYDKPPIDLSEAFVDRSDELIEKLENFGVTAEVSDILRGPSVTRYELVLGDNIKVSKFTSLQPDLSVFFASKIRIEAPVPGKSCVGIEVPNKKIDPVYLKEIIGSEAFENKKLKIPIALGKDIAGDPVVGDLTKMPHLLVAGSTGSGKSVCMNCLITSILYNFSPNEVQMVMIDPKRVELSMYEGIPHLIDIKATPDYNIITDPKIAALVLNQMTETMDRRYDEFNKFKAKNIFEFNAKSPVKYPYLIIFIDELADLMMVSGGNIETPICRIAQMGRAAGIHLVIATQRPTVNVITGTIKVNVPSRIAFAVTSSIDSRTILDKQGAEELLGKGDMLYQPIDANEPKRVQGAYISTEEIEDLVAFWQEQPPPDNMMPIDIEPPTQEKEDEEKDSNKDALYDEALNIIMAEKYASVSILQRKLKIGYARAGRIIDQMERNGVVGPAEGSKPRKILIGANAGS